jgi:hypothetical protein
MIESLEEAISAIKFISLWLLFSTHCEPFELA